MLVKSAARMTEEVNGNTLQRPFDLCPMFAGTSVVTVTASDADDQTYGNSAKLVYSILQGQPYFSVDSENGKSKPAGCLGCGSPCYARLQ